MDARNVNLAVELGIEFFSSVKVECLERNLKARDVAAELQSFIEQYPEAELRREGMKIVRRLKAIGDSSE